MYQLTCPSCTSRSSSSFVRHGAVVRCGSCDHRYRVKSSYLARTVTTGPKTLDEMDPLLRGDSVDLDNVDVPDDAAPVKIDEDGNVVGLSGLSELMRQSDAAHAQAAAIARTRSSEAAPPPAARVTRPADTAHPADALAQAAPASPTRARARTRRPKRKQSNGLIIAAALLALACAVGVLAYVISVVMAGDDPAIADNPGDNTTPGTTPGGNPGTTPRDPDLFPDTPGNPGNPGRNPGTHPGTNPGTDPGDMSWLTSPAGIEPNEDYTYTAPAARAGAPRPVDVPTVLSPAQPMTHEGWYILTPPRGSVEAAGNNDLELTALTQSGGVGETVVLVGELTNRGERVVLAGEAHVALLDASARVFAETYLPFAALAPGQTQPVRLTIPLRHWGRARDVRTRATALEEATTLDELPDAGITPAGADDWASARVTARNAGRRWLRDAAILLQATDPAGQPVAQFRLVQDDLYIAPDGWLDIVIHTPLPEGTRADTLTWNARVIRR